VLPQLDAFAAAALAYAAGRPRRAAIAVGNSLGGCVTLRLAERQGRRLAGAVAVAPAGLAMSRLLGLVERDPVLSSLLALPSPVPSVVIRAAVARLYRRLAFASPRSVEDAVVAAFTRHHRERATVAGYLAVAHRLLPELRSEPFRLGMITAPVLVVWGERDRLVLPRGAQEILDAVPGARLELLAGIGHCPQVEAPARFTELLLEFALEAAPGLAA
jgi:pimeloyl-ACP methyl ester carboxylesterase